MSIKPTTTSYKYQYTAKQLQKREELKQKINKIAPDTHLLEVNTTGAKGESVLIPSRLFNRILLSISPEDIAKTMPLVCRRWYARTRNSELWKALIQRDFKLSYSQMPIGPVKKQPPENLDSVGPKQTYLALVKRNNHGKFPLPPIRKFDNPPAANTTAQTSKKKSSEDLALEAAIKASLDPKHNVNRRDQKELERVLEASKQISSSEKQKSATVERKKTVPVKKESKTHQKKKIIVSSSSSSDSDSDKKVKSKRNSSKRKGKK